MLLPHLASPCRRLWTSRFRRQLRAIFLQVWCNRVLFFLLLLFLQCVARRDVGGGLGGSDTCHFCGRRVYVMERLSAEGHFFHRECFRCHACHCTLRLGGHAFDSQEGTTSTRSEPAARVLPAFFRVFFF